MFMSASEQVNDFFDKPGIDLSWSSYNKSHKTSLAFCRQLNKMFKTTK